MKIKVLSIVVAVAVTTLAGSVWASDYGMGGDLKEKELQDKATDLPNNMLENKRLETKDKVQGEENIIDQQDEEMKEEILQPDEEMKEETPQQDEDMKEEMPQQNE
jgi:hypothetical protein